MYIIFTAIHRIVQSPFLHNGSEAWTSISVILKFSHLYWLSKKIVGGGVVGMHCTLKTFRNVKLSTKCVLKDRDTANELGKGLLKAAKTHTRSCTYHWLHFQ